MKVAELLEGLKDMAKDYDDADKWRIAVINDDRTADDEKHKANEDKFVKAIEKRGVVVLSHNGYRYELEGTKERLMDVLLHVVDDGERAWQAEYNFKSGAKRVKKKKVQEALKDLAKDFDSDDDLWLMDIDFTSYDLNDIEEEFKIWGARSIHRNGNVFTLMGTYNALIDVLEYVYYDEDSQAAKRYFRKHAKRANKVKEGLKDLKKDYDKVVKWKFETRNFSPFNFQTNQRPEDYGRYDHDRIEKTVNRLAREYNLEAHVDHTSRDKHGYPLVTFTGSLENLEKLGEYLEEDGAKWMRGQAKPVTEGVLSKLKDEAPKVGQKWKITGDVFLHHPVDDMLGFKTEKENAIGKVVTIKYVDPTSSLSSYWIGFTFDEPFTYFDKKATTKGAKFEVGDAKFLANFEPVKS